MRSCAAPRAWRTNLFFVSYRMNDWHSIQDKTLPTHNAFWREHPEYWLGDRDVMGMSDNLEMAEEMCTRWRRV